VNAALPAEAMSLEQRTQALLDLIEADRAKQCAQILGEARQRAAALRAQARADALARLRQVFAEQRVLRQQRIAAAHARLATRRRLHAQQRHAALLRLAWERLPDELLALWRQPAGRGAWVAHTLASARARMPQGPWRIVHAPDWPPAERQTCLAEAGATPAFEVDPAIVAGLKIVAQGNVVDGTLAGLLADRAEFESRALRLLEEAAP
jgi:hypothetical protein